MDVKSMAAAAAASLALLGLAGCGDGGGPKPPMGKVHGKVTYNGQPFSKGSVTFVPIQGKGGDTGQTANGPLESDGSFDLTTFNTGDVAIAGQHTAIIQVRVDAPPPVASAKPGGGEMPGRMPDFSVKSAQPAVKPPVPDKYTKVESSPLKFTVEAGKSNDFEISLKD